MNRSELERSIENSIKLSCDECQMCDNKFYHPQYATAICCCLELKFGKNKTHKSCCTVCKEVVIHYTSSTDSPTKCIYCKDFVNIKFLEYNHCSTLSLVHDIAAFLNFNLSTTGS